MSARKLTPEQEDVAFEHAISGETLSKTAQVLGFNSPMAFYEYRKRNPAFSKALSDARIAGNEHIEDEIRFVADDYLDPQKARVKMESLCRILAYRDPSKYGNKVDISISQAPDMGGSLARMQAQIGATYGGALTQAIDVTPQKPNEIADLL